MSMNEPEAPRGRMPLAPDHFHPDHKRTSKAARKRALNHAVATSGHAARVVSAAATGMALVTMRSVAGTIRAAARARNLFVPRVAPADELASLLEASRYSAIANRLTSLAGLSPEEEFSIRRSTPGLRTYQAGSDLVTEGENATRPVLIASGWACRVRVSAGRRQIVSLLLPGDGIALRSGAGALSSTTVTTLTTVETVDARPLLELADDPSRNPGIFAAMHRMLTLEEEFLYNQVTRLGPMPAQQRLSHLLLELHWRLKQAGMATAREAPLPLGEDTLGDILAMKAGSVGNAMRQLQRRNLARNTYGRISLLDAPRMKAFAEFEPPAPMARASTRKLIRDPGVPAFSAASSKPVATSTPPDKRLTPPRTAPSA